MKIKIRYLVLLLLPFFVIVSCKKNDRYMYCDQNNFFCIHTEDTIEMKIKLGKIKSIFLENKYNFLKDNKQFICFEYYNNYVEIYNYNNEQKYIIINKNNYKSPDTNSKVIKEYLNKLSYDFSLNNLIKKNDTLILKNFRLPRSFPKSKIPPPLPPEMMFPAFDKDSLYLLQHNFEM